MTRLLMILGLLLPLTACAGNIDPANFENRGPDLVLEEFLVGDATAYGVFEDRGGTLRRQFTAKTKGTWDAGSQTLTLEEDFVYDDGETDRRVWTFKKVAPDRYIGTANDVIGEAEVRVFGSAATFSYLVDLKTGPDSSLEVRFTDWLYKQDDRVLINRAQVTKFGFTIGSVTVVFVKD